MVNETISTIRGFEELQDYVYETICADNDLLVDAFPRSKRIVRLANGDLCGVLFCVRGPRSVDFTAIWDLRDNRVFFYGPDGERYRQVAIKGAVVDRGAISEELGA